VPGTRARAAAPLGASRPSTGTSASLLHDKAPHPRPHRRRLRRHLRRRLRRHRQQGSSGIYGLTAAAALVGAGAAVKYGAKAIRAAGSTAAKVGKSGLRAVKSAAGNARARLGPLSAERDSVTPGAWSSRLSKGTEPGVRRASASGKTYKNRKAAEAAARRDAKRPGCTYRGVCSARNHVHVDKKLTGGKVHTGHHRWAD
jgi:hypothetical protein